MECVIKGVKLKICQVSKMNAVNILIAVCSVRMAYMLEYVVCVCLYLFVFFCIFLCVSFMNCFWL